MRRLSNGWLQIFCGIVLTLASAGPARAQNPITIDTSNPNVWVINNGVLTVHWLVNDGRIFSIHWSAFPNQELIDQTNQDRHGPKGFYMDNVGPGSSTQTSNFYLDPNGAFIDWWVTFPAGATNAFTWSHHRILFANDPGIHVYFVLDHGPGDIAGSIGQIQWVFRGDLTQFANTYSVNTGVGNLGGTAVPTNLSFGGAGRGVQDATNDLHGLTEPAGFRREFYTKYDYSSYEYQHRAQGVYGSGPAAWMVVPSRESLTGGPTKQDLIFTNNLLIMEAYSNHLDNQISFPVAADARMHRLYGPFYLHFNTFSATHTNAASLYFEALAASRQWERLYNRESVLLSSGYVPSMQRGEVELRVHRSERRDVDWGREGDEAEDAQTWAVLSDANTMFQYSHAGNQYWEKVDSDGEARFRGVVPGPYRLSVYTLGQWGELRLDGVNVTANSTTRLATEFSPENFSHRRPIWTIGTPDRSSHEFLHGTITNPIDIDPNFEEASENRHGRFDRHDRDAKSNVQDDREFWGNWNYWADFAANAGAVIYYATPVGNTPATNDLSKWNYNQWHLFDPGLYAGVFNASDQTTDGYDYICPAYAGGDCSASAVPDWQVHFSTTPDQQARGPFVTLSAGLAATESNLTATLNGNPLSWTGIKLADAGVRSGFSGTYQWVAFEWPASLLNAPGSDNVITFHVNKTQGVMYDALRLEIGKQSAAHETTGWNDYEYVNSTTYEPANDAVSNNGK